VSDDHRLPRLLVDEVNVIVSPFAMFRSPRPESALAVLHDAVRRRRAIPDVRRRT
jgi:hypothetical protein